ncbi:hypothetical protein CFC21_003303 [Triticum aestivum]|uniref:GRF-type domain-containing protein n=2 Tax=Triticum TaxID=4564 RepID=A0A9R0QCC9_TRITD|nr:uncharacterized protein LOC123168451 [Triticum aestivum]KAF6985442.1 hypothetical protein CFC21_003303 [Triticum aestivum]VAH08984.1 unnamed protein product [Triticum turgidum subsp. durum]
MANANQGGDLAPLPIVPCPDCGRNMVTYVACWGQNADEHFYKCRNHNPSRGGCDFYRWQEAYADHLASLGPVAPPLAQIQPQPQQGGQCGGVQDLQMPHGGQLQHNSMADGTQFVSSVSAVTGYILVALPAAACQGTVRLDPASINLVVSVASLIVGMAILVLLVADVVLRVLG